MIALTENSIDPQQLLTRVQSPLAGAVVLFLGTTRQFTAGRETTRLAYEAYRQMAEQQMQQLRQQAMQKWPLTECAMVHRLGVVELEQVSVAIAISAPHRRAAFEAAEWIMDRIKQDVPIWKQEQWADGQQTWQHPDAPSGETHVG